MYGRDDPIAKMPTADTLLTQCFMQLGVAMNGGMAQSAVTWQEIDAYCNRSGNDLNYWECDQLIKMSRAYVSAVSRFKDHEAEPPYQREYTEKELQVRAETNVKLFDSMFDF